MYPQPLIDAVLDRLREAPEREALTDARGAVTRGELFAASGRLAFELLQSGVRSGDRLLLGLPPDRRFVVALLGALRLGVLAVPVHPKAKLREVKHLLWDAGPRIAFADAPLAEVVRECAAGVRLLDVDDLARERKVVVEDEEEIELAREHAGAAVASDAPALILYTSGTTGRPKGAVHTHGSLGANLTALAQAWRLTADDRLLHCLPLHHLHGLVVGLLGCLAAGSTCELEPGFDATRALARLAQSRATLFFGVPAMYAKLLEVAAAPPLPALRLFVSGSAPLPPAQKRAFEQRFGAAILERYGATEMGIALSQPLDGARPAGSVGGPLPGVETRIARTEGADGGAADGEPSEGELLVRGPSLFRGYFEDEEATAKVMDDGWYRTGDLVRRDADGSFAILGRISTDLIKVKGHRVGALEVEAALAEHPRVAEVAVVGAPDRECGEVVVAFVRARDATLTVAEIDAHARATLAPHQVPSRVVLVDELPRTGPGKVDKQTLQARARAE
jgi:acyl-CoA synthetase (AMP-forming)/AMP-acid ligase II